MGTRWRVGFDTPAHDRLIGIAKSVFGPFDSGEYIEVADADDFRYGVKS